MRMAAMTTLDKASLFLDSVVASSGWSGTVATWDRFERLLCASNPLRLEGRMSEEILGERDSCREPGRDSALFAEGGLESGNGEVLVSMERNWRWPSGGWDSVPRAAAAAIPAPPFPLASLLEIVASSKMSRFRFGEPGVACASSCGCKN
jgi:hypothetical protein